MRWICAMAVFAWLAALTHATVWAAAPSGGGQACPPPAKGNAVAREIQITEADKGKPFTAEVGNVIVVRLPGNRDTGFAWQIVTQTGDSIKQDGNAKYFKGLVSSKKAGVGGSFVFRFKTVKPGKTSLKLQYVKADEKNKQPNTFLTTILVKAPQ